MLGLTVRRQKFKLLIPSSDDNGQCHAVELALDGHPLAIASFVSSRIHRLTHTPSLTVDSFHRLWFCLLIFQDTFIQIAINPSNIRKKPHIWSFSCMRSCYA
ncbi:hypothetical protein SDJN03_30091, partial [Cucurbita argyrosperma subsp. sororia]